MAWVNYLRWVGGRGGGKRGICLFDLLIVLLLFRKQRRFRPNLEEFKFESFVHSSLVKSLFFFSFFFFLFSFFFNLFSFFFFLFSFFFFLYFSFKYIFDGFPFSSLLISLPR